MGLRFSDYRKLYILYLIENLVQYWAVSIKMESFSLTKF